MRDTDGVNGDSDMAVRLSLWKPAASATVENTVGIPHGRGSDAPLEGDVYRDLPPELIATLRDPRVILPGELDCFDAAYYYDGNPPTRTYRNAQGNTIPVQSDT